MSLPVLWSGGSGFPECWRVTNDGFWKLPAVGSVQLLRCLPAVQEADEDRVVVLLRLVRNPCLRKPQAHT